MSGVISPIDIYLHKFIIDIEPNLPETVQQFLFLVLSLQDDGNTQFTLNPDVFYEKWATKWNGLLKLYDTSSIQFEAGSFGPAESFKPIIETAIQEILANRYESIIEWRQEQCETKDNDITKVFVAHPNGDNMCLYFTKFFDAKCSIERITRTLFKGGSRPSDKEIQNCIKKIADIHVKDPRFASNENPNGSFFVNTEQAEAIIRGQNENLIITGGPGTGKTTVVLYILWCLLESNSDFLKYDIRLAAPSGKAADRMRESLIGGLSGIEESEKEAHPEIFKKLSKLDSCTIHRMLKYSPSEGNFHYNEKNPFNANSIFVIDEASMTDISLFAAFLQSVPEGAKVFILGDPYQLPSVGAGAVLGEILKPQKDKCNFAVKLLKSNRFSDDSEIGKLAKTIQSYSEAPMISNNSVKFIQAKKGEQNEQEKFIQSLVNEWVEDFLELPALARKAYRDSSVRDKLWNTAMNKKIISAEKGGPQGVEKLNHFACKKLKAFVDSKRNSEYFAGELLILVQNQTIFKLYNGDTGVVVFDDTRPYLMLKKDEFVFYPLSQLPSDSIKPAFAITIHKSQGSEYNHLMIFLPTQEGHPLLTNQILYTGITRAKKTITIVTEPTTFRAACTTVTKRETGITI